MKVTGVEAVNDPPLPLIRHRRLLPCRPVTRKTPVIELQPSRRLVTPALVLFQSSRRHEVFGAPITQIVLRGVEAGPIGRRLDPAPFERHGLRGDSCTTFGQQTSNDVLGLGIVALASLAITQLMLWFG